MTQTNGVDAAHPEDEGGPTGPVIRDKRKVDPQTGEVRTAEEEPAGDIAATPEASDGADAAQVTVDVPEAEVAEEVADASEDATENASDQPDSDAAVAAERLEDLRRLQAEFVNYRRRVERDRAKDRDNVVGETLEALLPVLDDIHSARQHGDVSDGPFASIVGKLEEALTRQGAELFGAVGQAFDPVLHEALMHVPEAELPDGTAETTIVQVIQPGFRVGARLVRPARVAVADPQ